MTTRSARGLKNGEGEGEDSWTEGRGRNVGGRGSRDGKERNKMGEL